MTDTTLDRLNVADKAEFLACLGTIFENAPWVAEAIYPRRPFPSLVALHAAMADAIRSSDGERQLALINGHPDLGGKAARAGAMTGDSVAEQASAGLDRLSEQEFATFHRLNDAYRTKFGFPFIICVRRHTKNSILRQFEQRLQNPAVQEREAALREAARIAALRLDQRVGAPDRLNVHGRLSTHVLDTRVGRPAAGVSITLAEMSDVGEACVLHTTVTNADGRTERALIDGRPIPIGRYELRFDMAPYFARQGVSAGDPPFLGVVPVRFAVAEPEGHYHVPLLVSPWSYTTYRGS